MTRFVQRLGYDTYEESRRHAREEKQTGSRLFLSSATDAESGQSLSSHVGQGIANLEKTFLSIRETQIDAVVEAMLGARKTWVFGFRSSQPFAAYLQWQMIQVVDNIVAVPGPGQTLGEYIASISPDDMVIVFALRRRIAKWTTSLPPSKSVVRNFSTSPMKARRSGLPRNGIFIARHWHPARCSITLRSWRSAIY